MVYLRALVIIHLFPAILSGQFVEDFSNSELSKWHGDTLHFRINEEQKLQLNRDEAGESLIYTESNLFDSLLFEIDLELKFSASSNNMIQLLIASNDIGSDTIHRYFLEIGESGSEDRIRFMLQRHDSIRLLASGLKDVSKSIDLGIRMMYVDQEWILECSTDGINWEQEFRVHVSDYELESFNYTGLKCRYTKSNADKFLFDKIAVSKIQADSLAPHIQSYSTVNDREIQLIFDEKIKDIRGLDSISIELEPQIQIDTLFFDTITKNKIVVHLDSDLSSCHSYQLRIANIEDLHGNRSFEQLYELYNYSKPSNSEIKINEILFDPFSDSEDFIEIINASNKYLDLDSLIIRNDDKDEEVIIEAMITLAPKEIVCLSPDIVSLKNSYSIPGNAKLYEQELPSFNNASGNAQILIKVQDGIRQIIDEMNYTNSMHDDTIDDTEGLSLERKQLLDTKDPIDNWCSSLNGASPGYINSIADNSKFLTAEVLDPYEIVISSYLDFSSDIHTHNFAIDNIQISDHYFDSENSREIILLLDRELEDGTIYHLKVQELQDVCSHVIPPEEFDIRRIHSVQNGDIVINEILFDPYPDNYDFIELKNISSKFLELEGLDIRNSQNGQLSNIKNSIILDPESVIAFSLDPEQLRQKYEAPDTALIHALELPAFNNDSGNAILSLNHSGNPIVFDSLTYLADMHSPLLSDTEGVSLERISVWAPSDDINNWHSSAQSNNYATPGYSNSSRIDQSASEEIIYIEPKVFSPDGDAYNDLFFIHYDLPKAGFIANVDVFTDKGIFIVHLSLNEVLGTSGFIAWDGTNYNGTIASVGMYIVSYVFLHPDGEIYKGKRVCVLAQNLE